MSAAQRVSGRQKIQTPAVCHRQIDMKKVIINEPTTKIATREQDKPQQGASYPQFPGRKQPLRNHSAQSLYWTRLPHFTASLKMGRSHSHSRLILIYKIKADILSPSCLKMNWYFAIYLSQENMPQGRYSNPVEPPRRKPSRAD